MAPVPGGWQLPLLARLPLPVLWMQSTGCVASSGPLGVSAGVSIVLSEKQKEAFV